jgi:RNA polymerase sigma factor for flagellar operon FliA
MTEPAEKKNELTETLSPTELIEEGQGLVRSIALKVFRGLPVPTDLDDLIAYGQLGLAEAAQAFDPKAGTKFTTFAYYRVRGAIYDGVSKMAWTSRARIRRLRFQSMADDVLENEHADNQGGDGSVQDDAAWLGRMSERLAVVYLATSDDDAISRSINDAADPHESPSVSVASRELQQKLPGLVDQLDSQARRLITGIYFDGFSLTQAAERAGISKSWASRIHAKSLDKLAKSLRDLGA